MVVKAMKTKGKSFNSKQIALTIALFLTLIKGAD